MNIHDGAKSGGGGISAHRVGVRSRAGAGLGCRRSAGAGAAARVQRAAVAGAGARALGTAAPGHWDPPAPGQGEPPSAPGPAPAAPSAGAASADTAGRLVEAVNRYRADAGCDPVRPHAALTRAARSHSADMAREHRLSHTGPGASTPADRMRAAGYRLREAGEAVAAGAAAPEDAVQVWMDSAPHRAILLTCRYRHAGVGAAAGDGGPWWTLDLATDR